jgi:hypothetical protein
VKNVPILLLMLLAVVSCGPQEARSSNDAKSPNMRYLGETPGCKIYSGFEHGIRFFVTDGKGAHDNCSISTAP